MNDYSGIHTFAICVYGESPYLEACIRSLQEQTVSSALVMVTSTPSNYSRKLAEKYRIDFQVSTDGNGIAHDWNAALDACTTRYCTLAHQDDIYLPQYTEKMLRAMEYRGNCLIGFSDYADLIEGRGVLRWRPYLMVKRLLLAPFYFSSSWSFRLMKQAILMFGAPICCPSVTYNLEILGQTRFSPAFSVDLDWFMWLTLAKQSGAFLYLKNCLMYHRLDSGMETAKALKDHRRQNEDRQIFELLYPRPIARLLAWCYASSYPKDQ